VYHLPMSSKYCTMSQAAKTPEFTFRKEPSDIDKLVMAIGSLTTSMHESHKSKLKFHEDERKNHKSNRKLLSELCEITKTQASEAHQCEQTVLNGIEAMGNNIVKAISSEIQAMSAHVDVLNQVSLDAIMK
jgi:Zn-dependent metalloprotease